MAANNKITSLGLLRGFAVLAVCFRHLAKPLVSHPENLGLLNLFLKYGEYGVHVFFVISGFVIPYSLYQANYKISLYFRFLLKRVVRLHPPYLAALAITLVIMAVSYQIRYLPNPETLPSVIQSLFYMHAPPDNPVFWTLRVEAQYYIFIGLFYALLVKFPKIALYLVVPVLLMLSKLYFAAYVGFFDYLVFFMIGLAGFKIYTAQKTLIAEWLLLGLLVIFSFVFYPLPAAVFSLATISAILVLKKEIPTVLQLPGEISYSIYLIHFPIGVKLINLLSKKVNTADSLLVFICVAVICIGLSWLFWKFIEKPSARLSAKIKLGNRKTTFVNYDLKN